MSFRQCRSGGGGRAARSDLGKVLDRIVPARWAWLTHTGRPARMPLDVYETEDEIVILASVPGLRPGDVDIAMEGGTLTIRGQFPGQVENVSYLLQERPRGAFSRSMTVHMPIDVEHAEAKFASGVLTLILPKAQKAAPKSVRIAPTVE